MPDRFRVGPGPAQLAGPAQLRGNLGKVGMLSAECFLQDGSLGGGSDT